MIKNNNFIIKNLKNVVFIGEHVSLKKLVEINKIYKLNSFIITSPAQKKEIDKMLNFKVFSKLDNNFKKYIKKNVNIDNSLFVSIKSRWIFKKSLIKNFLKNNLINYHPARLPYYRGGATSSWRIIMGDRIDCQLFHLVTDKVDNGPILHYEKSILPPYCKKPIDLENYSNIKIVDLYRNFIQKFIKKKKILMSKQPIYLGQYFPRLNTKENGWIDWSFDSIKLSKFIDAFDDPYLGACTMYKSKKVYLKDAQIHGGEMSNHKFLSGLVSRHDNKWLAVCTSDENSILISKVLDQKGKNIINEIREGDRFYTPLNKLAKSLSYKAKYGPKGLIK